MPLERSQFITPSFRWKEFIRDQDPDPPANVQRNLVQLANRLQVLRDMWGRSIRIISGWRTAEHNSAIGGASDSAHLYGLAADIEVPGWTPKEVQAKVPWWSGGLGSYDGHTHLDIRPLKYRWSGHSH